MAFAGQSAHKTGNGTAAFTITIPKAPMTGLEYVSPGTQGIGIVARRIGASGATNYFYGIDAKKSYCAAGSGKIALTCTIRIPLAAAKTAFVVDAYSKETSQSSILSTGSTVETIVAGRSSAVAVSMYGVVAYLQLSLADSAPARGTGVQIPLTVNAADASGNYIAGSYDAPVKVIDSDKSGATLLSAQSLTGAADTANLVFDYSGGNVSSATVTAYTTSALVARVEASAAMSPGKTAILASPSMLAVSRKSTVQVGGARTTAPYVVSTGADVFKDRACGNLVTVQRLSNTSFAIVPKAGAIGTCWLATSDSTGHHGSIPIILCRGGENGTSPSPTPSPNAAPVIASPSSVTFCPSAGRDKCKDDQARTTISQAGSSGSFAMTTDCPGNVAAITLTSTSGENATYTLLGGSATGKCSATFTGAGGAQTTLNIDVTAGGIGIN